jgi:hypothetical protein
MLEALVQPPKDVEHEDSVINGCAEVSQTVGHGLELVAVLIDREVTLNKSAKSSIKVRVRCSRLPRNWFSMVSQRWRAVQLRSRTT